MSRPAAWLLVKGHVQGVGYRFWAMEAAVELGLDGWVRNRRSDRSVEILAIGEPELIADLEAVCWEGPPAAQVSSVQRQPARDDGSRGFSQKATV